MLTFEEFFTKKKIDLTQLQQAEPALFAEFKKDFEPMGEKSFDHTKKFWFNKLRRAYHLKEEPKPAKTEIEFTEIASQAEPLESPTMEQSPAFKPRFKPGLAKPAVIPIVNPEQSVTETPVGQEPATPKPGFQPRFKMQAKPAPIENTPAEISADQPLPDTVPAATKPAGFKPRFSMKTVEAAKPEPDTKSEDTQITPPVSEQSRDVDKPAAYKPKFNIKNIKPRSEE